MIPKINNRGHSFKGVMAYLMHDKNATTAERVGWSETGNMHTHDFENAAKLMAWTDKNADLLKRDFGGSVAGRKTESGAVYHYSLAWAKDEQPDQKHQRETALNSIKHMGLESYQYVIVSHEDTQHSHIHVVVNLTDPETGKRADLGLDKRNIQKWALEYEREHGIKCEQREINAAKFENGESTKYRDKKQDYSTAVTRAFQLSDNGASFANALKEEGLILCPARRGNGFVLVDQHGDIQKLTRQLDPVNKYQESITGKEKGALIQARLSGLDRDSLPDANQTAALAKSQPDIFDKEADETRRQKDFEQAAHNAAQEAENVAKAEALESKEKAKQEASRAAKIEKSEKQARYIAYQKQIDKKTAASREKWKIDELTAAKDKAADTLADNSGFWATVTFKRRDAREALEAAEKTLDERLKRFEVDIQAFNNKRPEWVQNRELEKEGFVIAKTNQEPEQEAAQAPQTDAQRIADEWAAVKQSSALECGQGQDESEAARIRREWEEEQAKNNDNDLGY